MIKKLNQSCLTHLIHGLYTKFDANPEIYSFPLGTLDTDLGVKAWRHILVASKAP